MPREKNVPYSEITLCKICQSENRLIIEMWRYILKRTYQHIINFVNGETKFFETPLNLANMSVHFSNHVSEQSFWEEYARHVNEETKSKEKHTVEGWRSYWEKILKN